MNIILDTDSMEVSSDYKHYEELQHILNDFLSNLLLQKPDDVYAFARSYFSTSHAISSLLPQKSYTINSKKPIPVVIAGPSGVGKGTCTHFFFPNFSLVDAVIGRLLKEFPDKFGFSVSHTTRKSRVGEVNGVHYHFTTVESIQKGIQH